jgi:hypothetical protein
VPSSGGEALRLTGMEGEGDILPQFPQTASGSPLAHLNMEIWMFTYMAGGPTS